MNDPLPPLTDDDLSAHLDGEAGTDVVARLATDPAARTRLDELRAAAQAVTDASVTPLEPELADDLIARALDAPAAAEDVATPGDEAVVTPFTGRRGASSQWLVAAVVLVLVAAGLALVWSGTRDTGGDDLASETAASEREADATAPEAGGDGAANSAAGSAGDASSADTDAGAGSNAPTTATEGALAYADEGVTLPDLGSFDTSEALRTSLATAFPADVAAGPAVGPSGPITDAAVERCAALLIEVLPVEGDPLNTGMARVSGETVLVYEFGAAPEAGSTTTTVAGAPATSLTTAVRPAACDPLFVFQR